MTESISQSDNPLESYAKKIAIHDYKAAYAISGCFGPDPNLRVLGRIQSESGLDPYEFNSALDSNRDSIEERGGFRNL